MTKNPLCVFKKYEKRYGETYNFYFGGLKKVLVTSNPKIIQYVLQKNYSNYQKSEIQVKRMGHFLGSGLLTSHGQYWLRQRRLIQESFHKEKLVILMEIMNNEINEITRQFEKNIQDGIVDINHQMKIITFKLVTRSLFSSSFNNDDIELLSRSISQIQGFIVRQIVNPFFIPLYKFTGSQRRYESMRNRSDRVILEVIKERRIKNVTYSDLLQNLIDAKYVETNEGMTDKQILMESMQLLVAGHETSSNALSWILYLLSKHPECLRKVKAELNTVLGNHPLEYQDLHKLEYTTQVIEESLRLYPPFWVIDRLPIKDDFVEGVRISKNTIVMLFLYGLHHNPVYWKDPEKFDPDRFSQQEKIKHLPFTHLPFGGGPRVCIGGNYAMVQMLLILINIILKYEFEVVDEQKIEPQPMIIMRPREGIRMRFRKLSVNKFMETDCT